MITSLRRGDLVTDVLIDLDSPIHGDLGTVLSVSPTTPLTAKIKWEDGEVSSHPITDLRKISMQYQQPLNHRLADKQPEWGGTATYSKGDKVLLGSGQEGVVVKKEERAGFEGYVVRITKSPDPEQIGQTVGASPAGMKKKSSKNTMTKCIKLGQDLLIECEIADSAEKQMIGLQETPLLSDGEGMYFPYSPPKTVSFHMGSLQYPIDFFAVRDGKISKILSNIQPGTPGPFIFKKVDAVLEVPGGFSERHGIGVGQDISLLESTAERPTYDLLRTVTEAEDKESQQVPSYVELPKGEEADIRGPDDARLYLSRAFSKGMAKPRDIASDLIDAWEWNNPKGPLPLFQEWSQIMMRPEYREIWLQPLDYANTQQLLPLYHQHSRDYQGAWVELVLAEVRKELQRWSKKKNAAEFKDYDHFIDERFEDEEYPKGPVDREPGERRRTRPQDSFVDREIPDHFVPDSKDQEQTMGYQTDVETEVPIRPSARLKKAAQVIIQLDPNLINQIIDDWQAFQNTTVGKASTAIAEAYDNGLSFDQIESKWREVTAELDYWSKDSLVHGLVSAGYSEAVNLLKVSEAEDFEVGQEVAMSPRSGDAFEGIRKDTPGVVKGVQDEMVGVLFDGYPVVKWVDKLDLSIVKTLEEQQEEQQPGAPVQEEVPKTAQLSWQKTPEGYVMMGAAGGPAFLIKNPDRSWTLRYRGGDHKLPPRASFDHAEALIMKLDSN